MKIIISGANLNIITGATLYPRKLGIGLELAGNEVKILTPILPKNLFSKEKMATYIKLNPLFSFSVIKQLREFNADAVIINTFSFPDVFLIFFARYHRIPAFFIAHNKMRALLETQFRFKFIIDVLEYLYLRLLKGMYLVFVLNSDMNSYLKTLGIERTALIDNPVDLDIFYPKDNFVLPKFGEDFHAVYVANISKRKNQLYLLKVAEFLPENFYIHFIGGHLFSVVYYREFKMKLNQSNLKNVVYHKVLNTIEISAILRNSHLYVTSSLLEGKSLSQIEALATGLPTVRLYSKHTTGITKHNHTALHIPIGTKPEIFAKTMENLVKDKKTYMRMRENAINERIRYSQSAIASDLVKTISKYTD